MSGSGVQALLLGAGFVGGAMNAMAGGGSFVGFPALVFAGLPSVAANASSTVALYPGAVTSVWAYRDSYHARLGLPLLPMLAASLLGGTAGAMLLLSTPVSAFDLIVPWLLLLATLAFAFGGKIGVARHGPEVRPRWLVAIQFVLAVYGGYFGGAVGIMMLATWGLFGWRDLRALNPLKVLLVGASNSIAVVCFIVSGAVVWRETIVVLVAAAVGGYCGARVARRIPPAVLRGIVLAISAGMTGVFFVRAY